MQIAGAGLNVEGDIPAAAGKVRSSPVRGVLVAALDDWSALTVATGQSDLRGRLLAVARLADPDPAFRDRLRDEGNWLNLAELQRLAAEAARRDTPAVLLQLLAGLLNNAGGDPVPLLRAAQSRDPDDFWINFELGNYVLSASPAEAVGFYRAALAVEPRSKAVWVNLTLAPVEAGLHGEAVTAGGRAVALAPEVPLAWNNLAAACRKAGRPEEALRHFDHALQLDPELIPAVLGRAEALAEAGRPGEAREHLSKVFDSLPEDDPVRHLIDRILGRLENGPKPPDGR